ncbi:MAG: glycosyltransferase [Candidatus Roizmanbacteria bacterium]|nr:glycosyltransferase [Candidatus Roizmanbacteria bacterium]
MKEKNIVVVLPTYNEKENVSSLIKALFDVGKTIQNWKLLVLVVDDRSPDGTGKVVKQLQKKYSNLYLIEGNKEGLGKAYQRGFRYGLDELDAHVLVEMDADWSHNPKDLPKLVQQIERGADMVIGSRYMPGGSIPDNWGWYRKLLSVGANLIVRLGFMNLRQREWTNGYRMIKAWVAQKNLPEMGKYHGYLFQIAFLDKTLKLGARIDEVPIHFIDRTYGQSKINAKEYIMGIVSYILFNSSFIKYIVVGSTGFILDFGIAYLLIHLFNGPKVLSNVLSAEVAIISNFLLNNFWSFKHHRITGGPLVFMGKLFIFNLISSGSLVIQGFGLSLALKYIGDTVFNLGFMEIHSWIVYKASIIIFIIIPYSYILYTKVVWKKK